MSSQEDLSDKLAVARFQAAVNTEFSLSVQGGTRPIPLRLTEVTVRDSSAGFEQFAALFEGPPEPLLPQGTYAISHPSFGEIPLFIVPVARSSSSVSYEVCVVRRRVQPERGA